MNTLRHSRVPQALESDDPDPRTLRANGLLKLSTAPGRGRRHDPHVIGNNAAPAPLPKSPRRRQECPCCIAR
jgi:hypothetical protein